MRISGGVRIFVSAVICLDYTRDIIQKSSNQSERYKYVLFNNE